MDLKHNKHLNKNYIMIILCILVVTIGGVSTSYANGGPIDSNGLIEGGNIKFKEVKNIYIIDEKLDINISGDYIDVNVEYLLKNEGEQRDIEYVFPISIWIEEHGNGSAYLDNISMKDGEKDLEYSIIETKELVMCNKRFNDQSGDIIHKNLYSKLHFDEKETKKLNISYRTKGMFLDFGHSIIFSGYSDNFFSYDVSPASNWGNGKADLFTITVDYRDLLKVDGEIISTNLKDFEVNNLTDIYKYSVNNYDFKEHGMIEIDYSNKDYREKNLMEKYRLKTGMLKKVKVSSQLENQGRYNYDIKNLFDNDLDSCWAEGQDGYGIGDTIELRFDQGVYLMCVAAINGYIMNEDTYYDNARIKKLKVEFIDGANENKYEDIVEFEDIDYNQIDRNYIYKTMQVIGNYGDGRLIQNDNTYIKLTILDVYKGKKYQDTCISEMLIYGNYINKSNQKKTNER